MTPARSQAIQHYDHRQNDIIWAGLDRSADFRQPDRRVYAVLIMISASFQTFREHLSSACAEVSDELNIFRTGFYEPYADQVSVLIFKLLLIDAEIEEFLNRTDLARKEPKIG